MKLPVWVGPVEGLVERIHPHPNLELVGSIMTPGIEFEQHGRMRQVRWGPQEGLFGLLELMDNNPLVCADRVSVPTAGPMLALIAVGPLIRAGILTEPPSLIFSFPIEPEEVERGLQSEGWDEGASCVVQPLELGTVAALAAMAVIRTDEMESLDEIDDLYDEAYQRSFFITRDEDSPWEPELVRGTPQAVYRLRIVPDSPASLLTVTVLADRQRKAGADPLIHALNVMAGFEESLGLA